MLRKSLLARLGLLVLGFVTGAVVSIALLQGILRDLDAMKADAEVLLDGVLSLSMAVSAVESRAEALVQRGQSEASALAGEVKSLHATLDRIASNAAMRTPGSEGATRIAAVRALLPLMSVPGGLAGPIIEDPIALRSEITALAQCARRHIAAEQITLSKNLRALIIGLTIAALVMVNITVVVLLRTANMILRPVSQLLEGSRLLAEEHFEHRVTVSQNDEFAELAHAYNRLADGLALNEQRKVQALRHLAVTLNHELNNVIGMIDLRLELLNRASKGDPTLLAHFREIHQNLERMARTVASLREVRRVVLMDYMPGEQMLDLPRSVAVEEGGANRLAPDPSDKARRLQ